VTTVRPPRPATADQIGGDRRADEGAHVMWSFADFVPVTLSVNE